MAFEDMDRKMAERNFRVRAEKLKAELRSLPLSEKFRAVADFVDKGEREWALSVAKMAISELESLSPTRKEKP